MSREPKPQFTTGLPQRNLVYAREGEVAELRAEVERLRAALTKITRVGSVDRACNIARRALEHKP